MIALYKGRSLLSRLIRWRTWGKYSHAAFMLHDGSIIEAWTKKGVAHNPALGTIHTPGTIVDVFDVAGLTPERRVIIERFLALQCGKKYDYAGIFGFIVRAKSQNPDKWFCSELVFAAFEAAGLSLLGCVKPYQVSPDDLSRSPLLRLKYSRVV